MKNANWLLIINKNYFLQQSAVKMLKGYFTQADKCILDINIKTAVLRG